MISERESGFVEQRGPFKVISRDSLMQHFGWEYFHDHIINPDGTPGEYFWINALRPGVLVFPLDYDRNLYLGRFFLYASNEFSWEAPGGEVNEGETEEDAAARETREELGLELVNIQPLTPPVRGMSRIKDRIRVRTPMFLAHVQNMHENSPESGEIVRLARMPLSQAVEMVLSGEINSAETISGILLVNLLFQNKDS